MYWFSILIRLELIFTKRLQLETEMTPISAGVWHFLTFFRQWSPVALYILAILISVMRFLLFQDFFKNQTVTVHMYRGLYFFHISIFLWYLAIGIIPLMLCGLYLREVNACERFIFFVGPSNQIQNLTYYQSFLAHQFLHVFRILKLIHLFQWGILLGSRVTI